jgi:hypothetical protein
MTLLRMKDVVSVSVLIMCLVDGGLQGDKKILKRESGRGTTQCVSFGSNVLCRLTRNLGFLLE